MSSAKRARTLTGPIRCVMGQHGDYWAGGMLQLRSIVYL